MTLTNEDLQAIALLIDSRFDQKFDEKLSPINSRLDNIDKRLDNMDKRLDNMDNRLDKLESEISSLKAGQIELKEELRETKHKVTSTYELALEAWGQSTENRRWLESEQATGWQVLHGTIDSTGKKEG